MKIFVNSLIQWQIGEASCVERVLWIDPSGTDVVTIEITKVSSLPTPKKMADIKDDISANRAIVEKEATHKNEQKSFNENYVKEYENRRNEAWKLIEPLVKDRNPAIFFPKERGRLITELSKQTGRRKATIYDYLRRYWQNGQTPNALLPRYYNCGQVKERKVHGRKRGRPTKQSLINGNAMGVNVTPEIKELLLKGAEEFYLNSSARNLKDAWQQTKEQYFKKGEIEAKDGILVPIIKPTDEIPTFEQFKYYYKKSRDIKKEIVSRYGQNEYDKNKRPLLGNTTTMALGPGSVYQIDATVGDVYLVSYLDRSLIIGRPVIYIVMDVFSRLVTGMSIILEGPSWFGAMLALENATTEKVEFCKSFGIEISGEEWPSCQLPEAILADRGELIGPKTNVLIEALGIRVANTAVSRPDWKGIVERQFRTLNDTTIHWLPGAVRKKRDKFGKDYRLEAALDLNEFRKIVILSILNYNNNKYIKNYPVDEYMIKDHVEPYPIKLWNYGISCRSGHLRIPPTIIRLILLPREKATITASGIRFRGVYYICDLAIREQWFTRVKGRKEQLITVCYDPRSVDYIYVILEAGNAFEVCYLAERDKRFKGCDWYEVNDFFAIKRQNEKDAESKQQQTDAELNAKKREIIQQAKEATRNAIKNLSSSERIKGITKNRQSLRRYENRQNNSNIEKRQLANNETITVDTDGEATYIPPAQPYEQIRNIRKGRSNAKKNK